MKRILGAALYLAVFGTAGAQTTFMCGSATCTAQQYLPLTGIENLSVDGRVYDVTFSTTTEVSPFLFSDYASTSPTHPTAVDAANAINDFFGSQQAGALPQDNGPGGTYITAQKQVSGGVFYGIAASTFFGYTPSATLHAAFTGDEYSNSVSEAQSSSGCSIGICTIWSRVPAFKAPELAPRSLAGALTLLVATMAVIAGPRRGRVNRRS